MSESTAQRGARICLAFVVTVIEQDGGRKVLVLLLQLGFLYRPWVAQRSCVNAKEGPTTRGQTTCAALPRAPRRESTCPSRAR